jgi:DNA-binding protein HU-beta
VNRSEIVTKVAVGAKLPRAQAELAVNAVIESIASALARGAAVTLAGFGTFTVTDRSERKGNNFQTGQPVQIPARRRVGFRPGRALNQRVGVIEGSEQPNG